MIQTLDWFRRVPFASSRLRSLVTPFMFLGVTALTFGLWIPRLGFFGNDWSYIYYYHLLGAGGPGEFASIDRPLSGWFYALSTSFLGESSLGYHLFLLILRWLSVVLLWWLLRLVWPTKERQAVAAAVLFGVYPGFLQGPIAVEFILHFFILDLFFVSLAASLLAVLRPGRFWLWLSLAALGALGVFSLEYFVGLEALRPIFLWFVTRRKGFKGKAQWALIFKACSLPWLAVAGFFIWRVFIFQFPTYGPVTLQELGAHPLTGLVHLVKFVANSLVVVLPGAWLQVLHLPAAADRVPFLVVLVISFALIILFLNQLNRQDAGEKEAKTGRWGVTALWIGLLALLAGGLPFWITTIPITLEFPWDRSTLPFMLGVSLVLAGLLDFLPPRMFMLAVALLACLAVGWHYENGKVYYEEGAKLQSFAWQLAWRVPGLKPGSLVLFDVIPLNRTSDNDLTALLNWTYAPDQHTRQIDYKFFDLTVRLNAASGGLPGLEKGLPIVHNQRGLYFSTTTSHTLALEFQPPGCLKILASEDDLWGSLPDRLQQVLPMTTLTQIQVSAEPGAHPPAQVGNEPSHTWCYLFEKADLARQKEDWQAVAALGDQAVAAKLQPQDPSDWLVFVEGYARENQWERAKELTHVANPTGNNTRALCSIWERVQPGIAQKGRDEAQAVLQALSCNP